MMTIDDIYSKYNIDKNRLKRDYIVNPLKKILVNGHWKLECPYKEDLEYLYNEIGLDKQLLFKYFDTTKSIFDRWLHQYNIKRLKSISNNKRSETNLKKYGNSCLFVTEDFKIKKRETNLKKYGKENFNNIIKINETKNKKNEIDNTYKPNIIKKIIETKKQKPINLDNYQKTIKQKYGCLWYFQSSDFKSKREKTLINKYGTSNITVLNEIIQKQYQTKKKNNSFGKSKEEEQIYNLLCQKYNDVKRQFKSDKYPFPCDFYILSEDLYIEYQGFWMHGKEPYIDSQEQKDKVKLWESKESIQYKRAIDTWTRRDVLKRETVKNNNLNWLEFFNMNQFMHWFNNS